jgi:hypothetical protein
MADSIGLVTDTVVYRLEAQIVDGSTGLGMDAVVVDVLDAEGLSRDLVAHAKTNSLGEFSVAIEASYYQSLFLDRRPALHFRIYQNGQLPQPAIKWTPSETTTHLRISLNDLSSRRPQDDPAKMVVRGRVLQPNGLPVVEHTVTAYDQTLRGVADGPSDIKEISQGSATTDSRGRYRIAYDTSKLLRQGSQHADLVIRVSSLGINGTIIAESPQFCHAPTTAMIDLVVGNVALRGLSEYERVYAAVIAEIR